MAVPPNVINLAPNPRSVGTAYSPNDATTASVAITGLGTPTPTGITTATRGMKLSGTGAMIGSWFNVDGQTNSGTVRSIGAWFRASVAGYKAHFSGTGATMTAVTLPANTWTWVSFAGYTGYVGVYVTRIDGASANLTDLCYITGVTCIAGTVAPTTNFDGASPAETYYTYKWNGAANNSSSTKEYYGIWAEQIIGSGAPAVQVTAIGLGVTNAVTQVTRQAGREVWSVPGWKRRNSLGADTYKDATPPLGRPVTYTLVKDGLTINSMTITVESTTGWIQDPLSPETAMPVATIDGNPAVLALAKAALKRMTYGALYEEETPLGGQYPIVRANQRAGASGLEFHLNAYTNVTSDALQQLVLDTPIILFRGLPSWGSLPALAYLIGDVDEEPENRDRGGQFTRWVAGGKLAAPVSIGPLTGNVTNADVQASLAGRTNSNVQATTGTKRNIDVQANPLGLGQ